jgi:hypothetical protein
MPNLNFAGAFFLSIKSRKKDRHRKTTLVLISFRKLNEDSHNPQKWVVGRNSRSIQSKQSKPLSISHHIAKKIQKKPQKRPG